jgi:hypothetical protein
MYMYPIYDRDRYKQFVYAYSDTDHLWVLGAVCLGGSRS